MNPDSANVELETVKQSDEQEYVDDEVTQESGTFFSYEEKLIFTREKFPNSGSGK